MHNKKIQLILFICLFVLFGVPSSLGILKRHANSPTSLSTAAWSVDVSTNSSNVMQLFPNSGTASYNLTVESDSGVNTIYSIIVSNLPSGVQVKLDNGNFEPYSSTVTFSNVGTILYGGNPVTHTLTFKANTGATIVSNQQVGVNVEFKQTT